MINTVIQYFIPIGEIVFYTHRNPETIFKKFYPFLNMLSCGVKGKAHCIDSEIFGERGSITFYIVKTEKPAIVETGPSAAVNRILESLEDLKIDKKEVKYVFVTHVHLDHGGGVGKLIRFLPNAEVVCHPRAAKHLINPEKLWEASKSVLGGVAEAYGKPMPVDEELVVEASDMQEFDLGDDVMLSILTPGHAPHHVSFFLEKDRILFPGDSAGVYGFGRVVPTTPPPFRLEDAIESLDKMIKLEPEFVAYTHFGFAENNKLLEKLKEKLVRWSEIALMVVEEGGETQELHYELMRNDEDYRDLYEITKESVIISGFHQLTLLGLIEYARYSKGYSKIQTSK